jgi:hypothetical protein
MSDAKNTPAPLLVGLPLQFNSGTYSGSIVTADGVTIAHNIHANIGPPIVRACNAHDALVAALEAISAAGPAEEPESEKYEDMDSAFGNGHDCAAFQAADIARRALKFARGES